MDELRAQDQVRDRQIVNRPDLGQRCNRAATRGPLLARSGSDRAKPATSVAASFTRRNRAAAQLTRRRTISTRTVSQRAGSRSFALGGGGLAPGSMRGGAPGYQSPSRILAPAHVGLGRAHARVLLAEADRGHAVERVEHVGVEARLAQLLPEAGGLAIGIAIGLQETGREQLGGAARLARRAPRRRRGERAQRHARDQVAGRAGGRIGAHAAPRPAAVGLPVGEQEAKPLLDARVRVVAGAAQRGQRPALKMNRDVRATAPRASRPSARSPMPPSAACDAATALRPRGDGGVRPCRGRSPPCVSSARSVATARAKRAGPRVFSGGLAGKAPFFSCLRRNDFDLG